MSVYRVIDVVGTRTSPARGRPLTRSKMAGQSVRDLRAAEVAKQGIHFGTTAISSTARRSSCPSSTRRKSSGASAAPHRRAPSVVITANTEANRICVVAQG
jgi:hypothetical protein